MCIYNYIIYACLYVPLTFHSKLIPKFATNISFVHCKFKTGFLIVVCTSLCAQSVNVCTCMSRELKENVPSFTFTLHSLYQNWNSSCLCYDRSPNTCRPNSIFVNAKCGLVSAQNLKWNYLQTCYIQLI